MVVTILNNTAPFYTLILGYYILQEKVTSSDILCLIGCFSGVLVLSLSTERANNSQTGLKEGYNPLIGIMCCMFTAIGYSSVIVLTRKLKNIHYSIMLFQYGFWATSLFLIYALIDFALGQDTYPSILYLDSTQWKYLGVISVMNSIAQYFATIAFQNGKSGFISLIGLINVFYAFIIDVTIFSTSFNKY